MIGAMSSSQGSAPVLRVEILGPLRVLLGGVEIPVPGLTLRRLLIRLVLGRGRVVSIAELLDCVWPDEADVPGNPKAALQSLISRLRRLLGAGRVMQREPGYLLSLQESDVADLRRLLRAAETDLATRGGLARTSAEQALALQRGESLADVAELAWATPEIARLAEELDQTRLILARAAHAEGDQAAAVRALQPVHQRDPSRLDVTDTLARALADLDRGPDALATIDRTARALGGRLGLDLSPALATLRLSLLRGDYPQPSAAESRGTGQPQASQPQPGGQLPPGLGGLPAALSSFIGRQDVIDVLVQALAAHRLVTLVGPGGAGKTRTALEAAHRLAGEGRRVGLVELAGLPANAGDATVEAHIARDLELPPIEDLAAQRAAGGSLPALHQRLVAHLEPSTVIVLDNCEHVLESVARQAERLLAAVPELRVIATSREPLSLEGEQLLTLVGLDLPGAGDFSSAAQTPSVRLFADRAAAADHGFSLSDSNLPEVIQIVCALDGLPLALELAAARLRVMSLLELRLALADRFAVLVGGSRTKAPRHRSLRDLIDWSWEPLDPLERAVMERFSVFAGGASLAGLVMVCADVAAPRTVERVLHSLVERSLIVRDEDGDRTRFRLLESIREYALDRLERTGTAAQVRTRHANYFLVATHRLTAHLHGARQVATVRSFDQESDNLRLALGHFVRTRQIRRARSLLVEMAWFWTVGNRQDEAEEPVAEVLALGGDRDPLWWTVTAFGTLLRQDRDGPDTEESRAAAAEVIAGLRAHLGAGGFVPVLLAVSMHQQGQHLGAHQVLDEALLRLETRPRYAASPALAILLSIRAALAENLGDLEKLRESVDAVLSPARPVEDPWALSQALEGRAYLRSLEGDLDGALADALQASELSGEGGEQRVFLTPRLIQLYCARGDLDAARAVLADAERYRQEVTSPDRRLEIFWLMLRAGARVTIALTAQDESGLASAGLELLRVIEDDTATGGLHHHLLAIVEGMLGAVYARTDPAQAADRVRSGWQHAVATHDRPIMAAVGEVLALVLAETGQPARAATVLGALDTLRGSPDPTSAVARTITRTLGTDPRASHSEDYARGRRLPAAEAIALVAQAAEPSAALPADARQPALKPAAQTFRL